MNAAICLMFAFLSLALASDKDATEPDVKKEISEKQKAQRPKMKDCNQGAKPRNSRARSARHS